MFGGGRAGFLEAKSKANTNGVGQATVTSKGWTLESLLETGKNFKVIDRISALDDLEEVKRKVQEYEDRNVPLIVEDCHKHKYWDDGLFTVKHLERANSNEEGEYKQLLFMCWSALKLSNCRDQRSKLHQSSRHEDEVLRVRFQVQRDFEIRCERRCVES